MTTKQKLEEKNKAIADLKQHIHEGDVIYTVTRHRSASGMYRAIDCYVFKVESRCGNCGSLGNRYLCDECCGSNWKRVVTKLRFTHSIATALGYRYDKKHEAIGIGGEGRNADDQIVEDLSYALFGSSDKLKKEEI